MDNEYNVYEDINTRTGGELYLGIRRPGPHRKKYIYQKFHGIDGHTGNAGRSGKNAYQR